MGLFGWFFEPAGFCQQEFKPLYSAFVDTVVDTFIAEDPTAAPPRPHDEPAARPRFKYPSAKRLVAIGDVHGDMDQMKRALKASGLIDNDFRWCAGDTVAVQVGDQLDRGDREIQILYALERLQREAHTAGGALHVLNGNHETMNVAQDMRYGNLGGSIGFANMATAQKLGKEFKKRCKCSAGWSDVPANSAPAHLTQLKPEDPRAHPFADIRGRVLQPGSPCARRFFAEHPMVLQVGKTVFVHAGLHPSHLDIGVDSLNVQAQDWLEGRTRDVPAFLRSRDAVVWSREYSRTREEHCKCDMLRETLQRLAADRMVVGHTIQQQGVNSACGDQVIRVDVGMSHGCGFGSPQALEIINDEQLFRILEDGTRVPINDAARAAAAPPPFIARFWQRPTVAAVG